MNKTIRLMSIIAGGALLLSALVVPGCKQEDKGAGEPELRSGPAAETSDRDADKETRPRKAKYAREWEE